MRCCLTPLCHHDDVVYRLCRLVLVLTLFFPAFPAFEWLPVPGRVLSPAFEPPVPGRPAFRITCVSRKKKIVRQYITSTWQFQVDLHASHVSTSHEYMCVTVLNYCFVGGWVVGRREWRWSPEFRKRDCTRDFLCAHTHVYTYLPTYHTMKPSEHIHTYTHTYLHTTQWSLSSGTIIGEKKKAEAPPYNIYIYVYTCIHAYIHTHTYTYTHIFGH